MVIFFANLLLSLVMKEFLKSLSICRSCGQECIASFLSHSGQQQHGFLWDCALYFDWFLNKTQTSLTHSWMAVH